MQCCAHLPDIDFLPRALVVAYEVAAARAMKHGGVLSAGRQDTLVAQCASGHQKTAACARDHLIRWREMLERVVGDRSHALSDRLVLQMDAVDPAIDRVAALGGAVHAPIVAWVCGKPKAAEPISG